MKYETEYQAKYKLFKLDGEKHINADLQTEICTQNADEHQPAKERKAIQSIQCDSSANTRQTIPAARQEHNHITPLHGNEPLQSDVKPSCLSNEERKATHNTKSKVGVRGKVESTLKDCSNLQTVHAATQAGKSFGITGGGQCCEGDNKGKRKTSEPHKTKRKLQLLTGDETDSKKLTDLPPQKDVASMSKDEAMEGQRFASRRITSNRPAGSSSDPNKIDGDEVANSNDRSDCSATEYKHQFCWKFLKKEAPVLQTTNNVLPLGAQAQVDECPVQSECVEANSRIANQEKSVLVPASTSQLTDNNKSSSSKKTEKNQDNLDLFSSYLEGKAKQRTTSEYASNFISPTKFRMKDGGWIGACSAQTLSNAKDRLDHTDWFQEVVRLRELSSAFKIRENTGSYFKYMSSDEATPTNRKDCKESQEISNKKAKQTPDQPGNMYGCARSSEGKTATKQLCDKSTQTPLKKHLSRVATSPDKANNDDIETVLVDSHSTQTQIVQTPPKRKDTQRRDPEVRPTTECKDRFTVNVSSLERSKPGCCDGHQSLQHYRMIAPADITSARGVSSRRTSMRYRHQHAPRVAVTHLARYHANSSNVTANEEISIPGQETAGSMSQYKEVLQRVKQHQRPPSSVAMPLRKARHRLAAAMHSDGVDSTVGALVSSSGFNSEMESSSVSDAQQQFKDVHQLPHDDDASFLNSSTLSTSSLVANDTLHRAIRRKKYFDRLYSSPPN